MLSKAVTQMKIYLRAEGEQSERAKSFQVKWRGVSPEERQEAEGCDIPCWADGDLKVMPQSHYCIVFTQVNVNNAQQKVKEYYDSSKTFYII